MRIVVRLMLRLVLLVILVVALVLGVTAARVWRAGETDEARKADALVVLGAAQYDGRPQEFLTARLEHAKRLYDDGTAPRILTLGGKRPGDRFTEADAGQRFLVENDVPANDVLRIGEGNDTLGSIRATARVMQERGWTSAVVVTDPWHELRSTTMLADEGITAYGSPVTTGPSVEGNSARYVARETLAYLAYQARRLVQ